MKRILSLSATFIFTGLILLGCGVSQPPKTPEEVRLQLKWLHQAQFASFYMAQWR